MAKGHNKSDLQSLPECARDFIKLVIRKMHYRKKVRADVQAELAAHFEDELRDCKTDEEKEQKAQQIVEQFGDAKLLGILLRRAKKRCRPLWRTVVARTFQTSGVLILCFIVYCVYISLGKPTIAVNYVEEATRLARPVANEGLNAAPIYQKAIDAYNEPPLVKYETGTEKKNLLDAIKDKNWVTELTEEELTLLKQWLSDNADAIEFFKQAAEKPYCWWERKAKDNIMLSVLMPELSSTRKLAQMMVWQVRLKAHKGNVEGAFDDLLGYYRAGMHFKGPRTLIEQLVGIAIQAVAVRETRTILRNQKVDSQSLKNFQTKLEDLIVNDTYFISYDVEKFCALDFIQRCYTDNGRGSGHMIPGRVQEFMCAIWWDDSGEEPLKRAFLSLAISITGADRCEISREFEKIYSAAEECATKTPWQLHKEQEENVDFEMNLDNWSTLKRARYWPVQTLVPALRRVNELAHRFKTDMHATLATIAILRYAQDKGHCPENPDNLDELTAADYLKELPMDLWSDKPLVYKRTDDGFMLYGIGSNFKDDGGQVARDDEGKVKKYADEGDWVFWPVQK